MRTVGVVIFIVIVFESDGIFCIDITYAEELTDGRLLCKHNESDDELLRVQWFKSTREDVYENSDSAVVSWDGTTQPYTTDNYDIDDDYSLIIYNMSDSGIYSCYITYNNSADIYKYFVRLIVYSREGNATDFNAERGTLVSLPCRYNLTTDIAGVRSYASWHNCSKAENLQSDDQAIASWANGSTFISTDDYSLKKDFSLEIGNVSFKDKGTYRFIVVSADTKKASARDTQMIVYALPRDVPRLHLLELPNATVVNCFVDYVYPVLYPEFGFHHDKNYPVQNDDGTYNTSISGLVPDNLVNRTVECFFPHFNYTKSSSYYIPENISKCTLDPAGEHEFTQTSRLGLIIGVTLGILSLLVGTILCAALLITRKKSIKQRQQNDIKQREVMERMLVI